MRRIALLVVGLLALVVVPMAALAAPRSGGSFGGRGGFRAAPRASVPRGYSSGRGSYGGGGSHFFFFPSFGWGGGYGYGGGFSPLGTLMLLGLVGFGVVMVTRAIRRQSGGGRRWGIGQTAYDEDDDADVLPDRAWVYKVQLGLGRSARGIQDRLARFAAEGDTATAAGLGQLLQQTSLELMRERASIRYGSLDASGPMSLTNGETKMNGAALAERSRFTVERVRGAEGAVRRSDAPVEEGAEVLEYVVVTVVIAARQPVIEAKSLTDQDELRGVLAAMGAVPQDALLGLEVIWTPADGQDSLTSSDLMTTYPDLRSL
jgi:uncharacterized membrane protein